ncbi:MAG: hypothetical protein KTR24_14200 [Saprospiraceae bacterium]|nr:hypothetical protein [Saprospiraceae bacterium]
MDDYNYKNFKPSHYDLAQFPGPKAGESYIECTLITTEREQVMLGSFLKKPTVVETGSNTCPMFITGLNQMNALARGHEDIHFLVVYVREAHPGERTREHGSFLEKLECARRLKERYPEDRIVLCDTLSGQFHKKYGSLPNMIYVIDVDGTVLFRGDWNNIEKLRSVLHSISQSKVYPEEHFEPSRPSLLIALRTLGDGGLIAIWDFVKGLRGLLRLHREAARSYRDGR